MAWPIKRNDLEPTFAAQLLSGPKPVDLTGRTVRFLMRAEGAAEPKVAAPASVVDAESGRVEYTWQPGDTDTVGTYHAEFEVTTNGRPRTFPSAGYLHIVVYEDLG